APLFSSRHIVSSISPLRAAPASDVMGDEVLRGERADHPVTLPIREPGGSLDTDPAANTSVETLAVYREPPTARARRQSRWLIVCCIVFASLVPIVTIADASVSRWFAGKPLRGDIDDALQLTHSYSHGVGLLFITVLVLTLTPNRRWYVPRILTLSLGAGALATVLKMFVLRPRPNEVNLDFVNAASIWTFDWSLQNITQYETAMRSFPCSHTATAIGLTVGLCVTFPRGRWLFPIFCLLSVLQRLQGGEHFASDLMGGAAVGFAWAFVCTHPELLGYQLSKLGPGRDRKSHVECVVDEDDVSPNDWDGIDEDSNATVLRPFNNSAAVS
ncbi:MAG: phosphatase PAP2 family protein, partial [Planctomycetota bacterium]